MPTNRPFFASFFGAFRARTSPTFQAKSSSTSPSTTLAAATAHISSVSSMPNSGIIASSPRTITTKASPDNSSHTSTNAATTTTNAKPTANTSPFAATAASSHAHTHARYPPPLYGSPGTSSPINSHSHNMSLSPPGTSTPLTRGRQRRGSDSSNSSGGFMDALGPEKWYIGGRTAGGEERFYRLGLVSGGAARRVGSADRLSL